MDIRMLRRHGDLVLGVAVSVLYGVEILRWEAADPQRVLPFALLGGLGLTLRRRTPLAGFLLAAASIWGITFLAPGLDNNSVALVVVLFVSLYSLGRYARGFQMWLGIVAVLVFVVVFILGDSGGRNVDSTAVAFATFFIGTPWAAGVAIRLRQDRERTLTARNLELQRDQEAQARQAVAAERSRIARELHDVVSHAIAVTVLQARGGRKMIGVDDAEVRRCLDAIEDTNTQALGDMRRLLSLLRNADEGPQTDPQPSLSRLDSLVEQIRASGLPVELTVRGVSGRVPPGVDLSAYHIVQESLTNVLKHAGPAAHARVEVTYRPEDLDISVTDDGTAPRGGDGRGHGLIGIRERVAVVGGHVEAGPGHAGGFVVHARLPYAVQS
jgi:signal transduction histidine kinase